MTAHFDVVESFKTMLRIDTSNPPGGEAPLVAYLARVLREHGIGYDIVEPEPGRQSIVARVGPHGADSPVVLISHLDVVPADPAGWSHPPFDAVEDGGIIYGRGALDTKYLTAMELAAFLRVAADPPARPVYFIATADEEQGSRLGMPIVTERLAHELRGGVVINEGGGFFVEHAGRSFHLCTTGEKGRCAFTVTIDGAPGSSAAPPASRTTDALLALFSRMEAHEFPDDDNPVALRFDELLGVEISDDFLRAFGRYNRRDAFILKEYGAGGEPGSVPGAITFDAELHLLPGRTREYAEQVLASVFHGVDAGWAITEFQPGFLSSLDGPAFASLERSAASQLNAELLPVFALGKTDGRFLGSLGCDVYGFGPVTRPITLADVLGMVHQTDERMPREAVVVGARIIEQLIRDVQRVPA